MPKRMFLFDTSPLLTLSTPIIEKRPAIEYLLPYIYIGIVRTVATEATIKPQYKDAAVVKTLMDMGEIATYSVPTTPVDYLIDAYNLSPNKGQGERDTIRLALAMKTRPIIDDQVAFFVAARFEVQPVMLLDVIVELTRSGDLSKQLAHKLVAGIAQTGRYTPTSVQHTIYKLGEVVDDSDSN